MRRHVWFSVITLAFAVGMGVPGCGSDSDGGAGPETISIAGIWETDYPETSSMSLVYFDFRSDGTLYQAETFPPTTRTGTWTLAAATLTITYSMGGLTDTVVYTVEIINADDVLLTSAGRMSIPLTRSS